MLSLAGFAVVWWVLPHTNDANLGHFLMKLATFLCVSVAIAFFPLTGSRWWWLLLGPMLLFAGYLFPRISWFYYGDEARAQPDNFYLHLYLLLYPAVIGTAGLAWRLARGSSGVTLKVIWTGVLILFSGFLDLAWQLVNPVVKIPDTLSPTHIVVLIGRPVTFTEIIWFTVAHVPLLILLLWAPLDRWLDRWLGPDPASGCGSGAA